MTIWIRMTFKEKTTFISNTFILKVKVIILIKQDINRRDLLPITRTILTPDIWQKVFVPAAHPRRSRYLKHRRRSSKQASRQASSGRSKQSRAAGIVEGKVVPRLLPQRRSRRSRRSKHVDGADHVITVWFIGKVLRHWAACSLISRRLNGKGTRTFR